MKRKNKMKKKIKKKSIVIILVLLFLSILVATILYFTYKSNLKKAINRKYNTYITTKKNINLYQYKEKKYQVIGQLLTSLDLELAKKKDSNSEYFKLKNSDYYIHYNDIKRKIKEISINKPENYLAFNSQVEGKKITRLYQNKKEKIRIKEKIKFTLLYKDEEYYYIDYLNQIYALKQKESNIEEKENNSNEESSKISILYYQTKPTEELWNEEEKMLLDSKMYTISFNDYQKWLRGDIRLKKNAVMLVSNDQNFTSDKQIINYISDEKVKLINNNTASTKENKLDNLSAYYITTETTKEYFDKIIKQETFEYPKKETPKNEKAAGKRNLEGNAISIPVINYHFFYDPTLGESCQEGICLSTQKFEEQLKYLKDNGFKTLKMEEFRKWMYGEIELPAKSVLLTVDDGAMGTGKHNGNKLIPLLEKYQSYATLFLITGWWGYDNYISPNLDVESHTHDMHTEGICSTEARGAKLLCSTYEESLNDLKTSISITKSTEAFCYPFFVTNEKATKAVQDAGFKLAFIGGNSYATRNSHKFKIPRFPIYGSTSLQQFINIVG